MAKLFLVDVNSIWRNIIFQPSYISHLCQFELFLTDIISRGEGKLWRKTIFLSNLFTLYLAFCKRLKIFFLPLGLLQICLFDFQADKTFQLLSKTNHISIAKL